ncbi:MAG: hypothetical protein ACTSYV_03085 [Candidatus Heimdallarchaeaceae archaeon]
MKHPLYPFIILLSFSTLFLSPSLFPVHAAKVYVADGDLISFGYHLIANQTTFEIRTEDNPVKVRITKDSFKPPGLYDDIIGMELGSMKDEIIVYPEEGYTPIDGTYASLYNLTLYYKRLKIYAVNGLFYTDYLTNGGTSPPFGKILLNIFYALLGLSAFGLVIFGGFKLYPLVFGKRCAVCKKPAIGTCKKCGKTFCELCYSNGCPYCKGRSLIRFK